MSHIRHSHLWCGMGLAVVTLVTLPVALVQYLPFSDYPFHLARIFVLSNYDGSVFTQYYDPGSWLLPNVAMDVVTVGLSAVFSAETAARIYVALLMGLTVVGAVALHYSAHGRLSFWPFIGAVVVFNGILSFGFMNYLFGVALALIAAAVWVSSRPGSLLKLAFGLGASLILMLCHMAAFGVFAVIAGTVELQRAWQSIRAQDGEAVQIQGALVRLVIAALPFLAAIVIFFILSPTADNTEQGVRYTDYLPGKFLYGPLASLTSSIHWIDWATVGAVLGLLGWAKVTGRLAVSMPLLWAAFMMGLCVLIVPQYILGADFADVRLGPVAVLVLIAALDIKPREAEEEVTSSGTFPAGAVVALVVLLTVAVRTGVITTVWADWEEDLRGIGQDFEKIEPNATVFSAIAPGPIMFLPNSPEGRAAWRPPVKHAASYATLRANAFVPMTFIDPTKQPLRISGPFKPVKAFEGDNPHRLTTPDALDAYIVTIRDAMQADDWPALGPTYLSVIGTNGDLTWPDPEGVHVVSRSNRQILIRLDSVGSE